MLALALFAYDMARIEISHDHGADGVRLASLPTHGTLDLYGLAPQPGDVLDVWMLRDLRRCGTCV